MVGWDLVQSVMWRSKQALCVCMCMCVHIHMFMFIDIIQEQNVKYQLSTSYILPLWFFFFQWLLMLILESHSTIPTSRCPIFQKVARLATLCCCKFNYSIKCNNGASFPSYNWIFIWHRPLSLLCHMENCWARCGVCSRSIMLGQIRVKLKKWIHIVLEWGRASVKLNCGAIPQQLVTRCKLPVMLHWKSKWNT